jgi:hypothetical protein
LVTTSSFSPGALNYQPVMGAEGSKFTCGTTPVVADFNGDGLKDIVCGPSPSFASLGLFLYPGLPNGSFGPPETISENVIVWVIESDFNRDGHRDLLVNQIDEETDESDIVLLLGNGDGTFRAPIIVPIGEPQQTFVGDYNGDGKVDILGVSGSNIAVWLGNGNGTFQPPVLTPISGEEGLTAGGDWNGDGAADVAEWALVTFRSTLAMEMERLASVRFIRGLVGPLPLSCMRISTTMESST